MKKALLFSKRNLIEMLRDPMVYVFCAGFPFLMLLLFAIINHYIDGNNPAFVLTNLVPGIMMFSYSFLMLMTSLLVSKDRMTSFLKRLYTSPLKPYQYLIGYFIPFVIVGLLQNVLTVSTSYVLSAITGIEFTSFGKSILLVIEMLPFMTLSIFLGIFFGLILNDKSAPAITSIFIAASGVLGGAWMPVDTMGGFETFIGYLPFYPSVYLGRIITGGYHTLPDSFGNLVPYTFDTKAILFVIIYFIYFVLSLVLVLVFFKKRMNSDN